MRKRRSEENVELNVTAMLDMAFQLLAFFIITYHAPEIEGDVLLRLPPPMSTVVSAKAEEAGSNEKNTNLVKGMNTLTITVLGSPNGSIHQIMFSSDTPIAGLSALDAKLRSTFSDPNVVIDQVILQIGSTLDYEHMMQVLDVCTRQKLPNGERLSKLSIVEAPQ